MQTDFDRVGDFHAKMGLGYVMTEDEGLRSASAGPLRPGPRFFSPDAAAFRERFMQEELDEFREAIAAGDVARAFDALVDLNYVVLGTAHLMGLPWPEGFALVHAANMAKERAAGAGDPRSKRGHALDVVKPDGWAPPDMAGLLRSFPGWASSLGV